MSNYSEYLSERLSILKTNMHDSRYPKLLIIDIIKDHGRDNKRVEKILETIFKFQTLDYQIIMTCGYEEFKEFGNNYKNLIIERIGDSKLLDTKGLM